MTQANQRQPQVISGLGDTDVAAPAPAGGRRSLPVLKLDDHTYNRALDCVHCGLCLPACPTYTENGLEADSPRGRIYLMKGLADGKIEATDSVLEHLDLCLDCRACETACPSGVVYHELIEEARAELSQARKLGIVDRFVRAIFLHLFTRPTRLKATLLPVRLLQKLGLWRLIDRSGAVSVLPDQLQKMHQMLPASGPLWETQLATHYPPQAESGERKARVGFFAGCVGSVLFQDVNRQAIALLQRAGCEVVVPKSQGCCGAIHHHAGELEPAEAMAQRNIAAFLDADPPVDYIVTDIAGCGAMLKDYGFLLRHDAARKQRGEAFTDKVRDISEVLAELLTDDPPNRLDVTATYHDACHLAHAQQVVDPPRQLLERVPGLELVPLIESDMCCGAAGTYNLTQPKMARDLAERKIHYIRRTGASVCVTGNVGCAMQIQSEADRLGVDLRVVHPVTLLHEAYFNSA